MEDGTLGGSFRRETTNLDGVIRNVKMRVRAHQEYWTRDKKRLNK